MTDNADSVARRMLTQRFYSVAMTNRPWLWTFNAWFTMRSTLYILIKLKDPLEIYDIFQFLGSLEISFKYWQKLIKNLVNVRMSTCWAARD